MGTGYIRNDTANNIADGNVINAADFDGEYDAIESAFNASTGHTHDGTAAEGGPISVVGPVQDLTISSTEVAPKTTNTLDIGTSSLEFKDLHLAGTANLPTVDIDAGAIDGTIIGGSTPAAGTFTNLTASTDLTLASGSTVTAILDEDTMSSDSDTSLATQQSIKAYVDTQLATQDALDEVLTAGNSTGGTDIDFGTDKALFGAADDLQIYHDGSDSLINDNGTGNLKLQQGGTTRIEVTATGVSVTDDLSVNTDITLLGDLDVGDDMSLSSDGAIINMGADAEVTLTHVADTGVLLNVENSTTNAVTDVLKLQAQSTGIPAVGIGTGIELSTETAAGNLETGSVIESVASGLTPTAEEFDLVFKTMSAGGTAAERMKLNGTGANVGNINLNGNTLSSTDTNGAVIVAPNGTGDVQLDADTVRVGDSNVDATITTNGTGDLTLNTNSGTLSGTIVIEDGANNNIVLTPNGTGEVDITKVDIAGGEIDGTVIGANSAAAGTFSTLTTTGIDINGGTIDGVTIGTNSAVTELQVDNININGNAITSTDTNGNINVTPDGTGSVVLDGINYPQADGTTGQYLKTDGAGTLSFDTLPASGLASVAADTTPQLGGDLDVDTFNIKFGDSATAGTDDTLIFGAGDDLYMYHDGTDSIIDNATSTGSIKIQDGGSDVVEITATGMAVTGSVTASTQTAGSITGSTTLDFDTYQNFVLTVTGNITLANPTTEKVGQTGFIVITQTGGYTVSLGSDYKTAGAAGITLSASGTDVIPYIVSATGSILLGLPLLEFS